MKNILLTLLAMFGLTSCSNAQNQSFDNMNVAEFADYLKNDDVQLLDVRTPDEFSEGHISGAMNIDWYDDNFITDAVKSLDKTRPIAIYCRSGKRSAAAAQKLTEKGYKVTNLTGGIIAWDEAKMPVKK
ncbi:MAG: rhodanese-like domain-containing protein [Muribaculaceae bacterium]|nr:rhodanese-like domain-containing protein [Muribaculaceae bacterium]